MYRDQHVPLPTALDLAVWSSLDLRNRELLELAQRIFCGGQWVKGDGHTIDPHPYAYHLPNQSKQP